MSHHPYPRREIMTRKRLRIPTFAVAIALGAGGLLLASTGPASAAACNADVRYASSTNTIYLVAPQVFTLSSIKSTCPGAPLTLVDPAARVWELQADLVVQNGATLRLHGSRAARPGDVDTLRLRSLASNSATEVSQLEALYGTIDMDSVHTTSWDDAAGAPDTDPSLPAGAAATDRGRAFVRALSYLDSSGVARESTMTINKGELDHLGFYGAEAYGVAFKARGCDHTQPAVCAKVKVFGSETGSHFHDNFMGTYTWGASGMVLRDNEYDHNVMYGLDPHDVSSNLTIDRNHFDNNGDHGVICSQRCDHLTITNNESDHNGRVPFRGPAGDSDAPGQVHGIMLHRGITNTVVSNNFVHDQPNGAGIAIFDTAGDSVHDNRIQNNRYGIRVSVGAADNTFTNNSITGSTANALYLFKGSDAPSYTTANGHPTGNVFTANAISGTGGNGVQLSESDHNKIVDCTFAGIGGPLLFTKSSGNLLSGGTLPSGQKIQVTGNAAEPGSLILTEPARSIKVSVDANSTFDITAAAGTVYRVGRLSVPTTVTRQGSDLRLTSATLGGTGFFTVTALAVTVVPDSGTVSASVTGVGSRRPHVKISGQAGGTRIAFTVGGLSAGTRYTVWRGGAALATVPADGSGRIQFSDSRPDSAGYDYAIAAA
jgi:parallel beta-helix repeat protein